MFQVEEVKVVMIHRGPCAQKLNRRTHLVFYHARKER
jgi:hypothetical protein